MADAAWKQFEREAAALFGGKRCWANSGERLDFTAWPFLGQCKLVKRLSLEGLTQLVEEMDEAAFEIDKERGQVVGVVCVKVRRGSGIKSPPLVVMSFDTFKKVSKYVATNGMGSVGAAPDSSERSVHSDKQSEEQQQYCVPLDSSFGE